ncbi:hypothetical protein LX32DRAFT_635594 [Colletotrichum zoysiae]|uniref:Uncharacterized protein n=1 Tax=Colletotrichum zoysiae TaxID=1216348 RepID=A0AAD9M4P2_9PEZI|nr:hypothetical protein LX32DRAFT_635594 [Colletotrichum zoysiae]
MVCLVGASPSLLLLLLLLSLPSKYTAYLLYLPTVRHAHPPTCSRPASGLVIPQTLDSRSQPASPTNIYTYTTYFDLRTSKPRQALGIIIDATQQMASSAGLTSQDLRPTPEKFYLD